MQTEIAKTRVEITRGSTDMDKVGVDVVGTVDASDWLQTDT